MTMNQLPNAQLALIEEKKLKDYLLKLSHPQGGSKARFFRQRGFSEEDWKVMAEALRQHALKNQISNQRITEYAVHYSLDCHCPTPDQSNPCIRTVWEIRSDDDRPRLVTAYPLG